MALELELQTLCAALVVYVLAGSLAIFGVVWRKRAEKTVLALLILGLAFNTASIVLRWERLGHGPYITMFEILLSNIWSLLAIYILAYWRIPAIRPSAAVVMPIIFVMMGWLLVTSPYEGHLPATYHTVWLFVHIAFGKLFLGNVLVAVGISGIILLREELDVAGRLRRGRGDLGRPGRCGGNRRGRTRSPAAGLVVSGAPSRTHGQPSRCGSLDNGPPCRRRAGPLFTQS